MYIEIPRITANIMIRKNYLLIYNSKSGKKNFRKILLFIKNYVNKKNASYKFLNIERLDENIDFSRFDTVVAIGGDGTILSVLPYIVSKHINLGIIPCGTANLLARKLGIPKNINDALNLIFSGKQKLIDVGKAGEAYFVLRIGYGIDADIVNGASTFMKNRLGYLAYLIQGFRCILNLKQRVFEITTENQVFKVKASALIVSNSGNMFSSGFSIAPKSELNDGKLDIFVLYARNIREFLQVFWQIVFNRHKGGTNVLYGKTRYLSIKTSNNCHLDGEECDANGKVDITLLHNALSVIAP